jgi:oxygen-independent coproporphyrinogen-3 oxidase
LSLYIHVPICASRCGYCDFNTYTVAQLGPSAAADVVRGAHAELALAAALLAQTEAPVPHLVSVFFGGGTPTMLTPAQLGGLLRDARARFGLVPGAEVTCEANPETITPAVLDGLLAAGFTRLSLGMQSAREPVLRVLDRVHTPGQALRAAVDAHRAGFADVNLDLIYGTPGESVDDWRASLDAALSVAPDHVSAYALTLEPGTRLARRIADGDLPPVDDDDLADKYLLADRVLAGAGLANYEISNWSLPGHECRHNLAYWHGDDWWGVGPGAHSHIDGFRWWNVPHPRAWGAALDAGRWPGAACELLDDTARHEEAVMLALRLAGGVPRAWLSESERGRVPPLVDEGLVVSGTDDRLRLTVTGRLLADRVTLDLLD